MSNVSHSLSDSQVFSRRYYKALSEAYIAATSFVRCVQLFFAKSPRTPLRALCIMAYDMVHVMDKSHPLPQEKVRLLADVLDFAASVNSAVDGKRFDALDYQKIRAVIDHAGVGKLVDDFVVRLGEIESCGRRTVDKAQACGKARDYREAVVRLNMGVLVAIAFDVYSLDEGIKFTHHTNFETLFRIVMLMQIIDDILDYRDDLAKGLTSFLTANELSGALSQAHQAAEAYARYNERVFNNDCFLFRLALICVWGICRLAIQCAHWRLL